MGKEISEGRTQKEKEEKKFVTRKTVNERKTNLKDPDTYISHNRGKTEPKSKRATTKLDTH